MHEGGVESDARHISRQSGGGPDHHRSRAHAGLVCCTRLVESLVDAPGGQKGERPVGPLLGEAMEELRTLTFEEGILAEAG